MRRERRLKDRGDFARVYRQGRPFRSEYLVLRAVATGSNSRFGFTASKALGNAVVRNRVKRRMREAVTSLDCGEGWDVVLNARKPAVTAKYAELRSSLSDLLRRAGVEVKADE